jgi:mono/diheme cytochrome c family protein
MFKATIAIAVVLFGFSAFLYSGLYPMGADTPHFRLTTWALDTLRENSITRASAAIEVPTDLASAERLLSGGADYNDMCAQCHLNPAVSFNDLSAGLYPAPPDLSRRETLSDDLSLARSFWIIKHGVKASGMPAWGSGHSDERIWNMVAFLQRLPELNATQYQILTARGMRETH